MSLPGLARDSVLNAVAAVSFEDHYIMCERCAEIVEATERYPKAMNMTAPRLRPARENA